MDKNLIFDIGLHRGEDTEFYLKKGFRVIGVEANPALCAEAALRFSQEIQTGQLQIINKAIAREAGWLKFYVNSRVSVWSTLNPEWAERNRRLGANSTECEVEATTLPALTEEFGMPYYLKIDIEGNDLLAVESLAGGREAPEYLSIESNKDSFAALRAEFSALAALGYNQFNIVSQPGVKNQCPPIPAREGRYAAHRFEYSASGLFGAELPGPWLSEAAAIAAYRPIFLRYALTGDDPFITQPWLRRLLCRLGFGAAWYDTHARRAS